MSRTDPIPDPDQDSPVATLSELRAEINRLDDTIHDLLMARAQVVTQVGSLGGKGRIALRPGREAAIIRRLLARHEGDLPRRAVVRIWRELLAATTAMQAPYSIAACEVTADGSYAQCAREHFGALTPLRVHRTPALALAEIAAGTATVAVLPLPVDGEPSPWWTTLLHQGEPRIHVVARLPFWSPRPEGTPRAQALVLAAVPPDPSGDDRSLIGLELPAGLSRARFTAGLSAAGLVPGHAILRRDAHSEATLALVDVEGFVTDGDPRLAALVDAQRPPVVLGAYAVPVEGDAA
ncbi:Chorismate mutase [Rhodovastum atsumiense]|uniref:chorismate mutase n=1 Tax=Rhodovastum atsumiense TaxID=504468 RepID=A0A5M6IY77_9PROT|nr:chorismate mutase [Rhodovastum atsumiense]KAA5613272.1 chorismate mutase [Rhodovastum atsumiense]CAH2600565.1 Chorismate mutase [Rhodovastum atsumiense]